MVLILCMICHLPVETLDDLAWEPVEPARADGYQRSTHIVCFARNADRRNDRVPAGVQHDIDTEQADLKLRSVAPDPRLKPDGDGEDLIPA